MSSTVTDDPFVLKIRREISDLDSSLVELVNKRLRLVAQLKRYKDEHGLAFLDPDREARMLDELRRENPGPLSDAGVADLLQAVLDLTKREVRRAN